MDCPMGRRLVMGWMILAFLFYLLWQDVTNLNGGKYGRSGLASLCVYSFQTAKMGSPLELPQQVSVINFSIAVFLPFCTRDRIHSNLVQAVWHIFLESVPTMMDSSSIKTNDWQIWIFCIWVFCPSEKPFSSMEPWSLRKLLPISHCSGGSAGLFAISHISVGIFS